MSDLVQKCSVCRALIDEEDLFCSNCGAEAEATHGAKPVTKLVTHQFDCQGCGASMSYDAQVQSLRCPFCGSEQVEESHEQKAIAPEGCVPFAVSESQAMATLKKWFGSSFWRPSDLARTARVEKIVPVYVPYWIFNARTFTYWTADSSQTPPSARGDWVPMSGEHHGHHQGLLIGASSTLTPHETQQICPFDIGRALPPERVDLSHHVVEQFQVPRKYARPLARQGLEARERHACQRYVPGRCRNLKVNTRIEDLESSPYILPVWILAYRYKGEVFRFLMNGQTGRHTGTAPFSWAKCILVISIVVIVFLILLAIGIVSSG